MLHWVQNQHPGIQVILGFLTLIIIGTVLLLLPISTPNGKTLTVTDAVFTATSAVCVTGLIVVQTPWHFTWFGELIIMILFQTGGIGIVLGSTMILLGIKGSMGLDQRFALQDSFINWPFDKIKKTFIRVFALFFGMEFSGALILSWEFSKHMEWHRALWHGIFHSISAVCNAGFSVNPDSLVGYQDNPIVVFTVSVLIIFGGLGFVVIADIWDYFEQNNKISLHTRTMLIGTVLLLGIGTFLFMILEPNSGLLNWFFQSVTARTAGFNTVDIASWGTPAIIILMVLMFIGAGPASTAGGIKITTFLVGCADVVSRMKQRKTVHWLNRRFPSDLVNNSIVLFSIALSTVGLSTFLLTITETASLEIILFEVFSALGTVGLSLGITMDLSMAGKWIIIALMFIGRLGPLTFALLIINENEANYTYPEERIMIG
ncbi:MAG: TrkH family potassium uptake protein [bacterium]